MFEPIDVTEIRGLERCFAGGRLPGKALNTTVDVFLNPALP